MKIHGLAGMTVAGIGSAGDAQVALGCFSWRLWAEGV